MRGKWAAGIPPRNFTWIIKDQLAISERPGGFSATHRKVRRQEEIIWLKVQGFTLVISLIPSPHNLAAYEERDLPYAHYPLVGAGDPKSALIEFFEDLDKDIAAGKKMLMHLEEMGDRVTGVIGGYLVWSKRIPDSPKAVALVERLVGHPMGAVGRELVLESETFSRRAPT